MLLLGKKELTEKFTFENDVKKGVYYKNDFCKKFKLELGDNWYGGRVTTFGILSNTLYLCLDEDNKVVDILSLNDELSKEENKILELAYEKTEEDDLTCVCGKICKNSNTLRLHQTACERYQNSLINA